MIKTSNTSMRLYATYLLVTIAASGLTYLMMDSGKDSLQQDVSRWRLRSYEAENKIAGLRKELSLALEQKNTRASDCGDRDGDRDEKGVNPESSFTNAIESLNQTATETEDSAPHDESTANQQTTSATDEQWKQLINGAIETSVEKLGIDMDPAKKRRILSALARIRDVSLPLQDTSPDENDSQFLRNRLQQSVTLLEVDNLFRKELGVGVSQFIEAFDENTVEEITPPSSPTAQ